ncbi:hypothetical protein Q4S20_16475, partial [Morganella morganii]
MRLSECQAAHTGKIKAFEVLSGSAAICEVVQLDEVDQVMAAITGVA